METFERMRAAMESTEPTAPHRIRCYGEGGKYYPPRGPGIDSCPFDVTASTEGEICRAIQQHAQTCPGRYSSTVERF